MDRFYLELKVKIQISIWYIGFIEIKTLFFIKN
jgi:hypothetical protein